MEYKTGAPMKPKTKAATAPAKTKKALRDKTAYRVMPRPIGPDKDGVPVYVTDDNGVIDLSAPGAIMYPDDDAQLARLLNGDQIPHASRSMKEVAAGDIADDVPAKSATWMLAKGWIVKANSADDPFKTKVKPMDTGGDA